MILIIEIILNNHACIEALKLYFKFINCLFLIGFSIASFLFVYYRLNYVFEIVLSKGFLVIFYLDLQLANLFNFISFLLSIIFLHLFFVGIKDTFNRLYITTFLLYFVMSAIQLSRIYQTCLFLIKITLIKSLLFAALQRIWDEDTFLFV